VPGGQRIVIQLERPAELPQAVSEALAGASATDVREPHPDVLAGTWVATVPESADVPALVEQLRALPEVRHAEPDQPREAL
jgi:hypothetical protein